MNKSAKKQEKCHQEKKKKPNLDTITFAYYTKNQDI